MKRILSIVKIIALLALPLAALGLTSCGGKSEVRTQTITEDFKNISIATDTSAVTVLPSNDGECKVVSKEKSGVTHTAEVSNGVLKIGVSDTRGWFGKLFTPAMSVTVYLPKSVYGSLSVECDTGDVKICNALNLGDAYISTDTGDVELEGIVSQNITVKVDTGDVSLDGVKAVGKIDVKTDTGDVELESSSASRLSVATDTGKTEIEGCDAAELTVRSHTGDVNLDTVACILLGIELTTGDVSLEQVSAKGKFEITATTGDITFDRCDAASVFVKTSTGDVRGSFLTDKIIFADTKTGKVDVPKLTSGGKCEITTTTGDIKITIE